MSVLRRRRRALPPSVRVQPDVPWVDPDEVATPLWRRALSVSELGVMILALGVVLAVAFGALLLAAFFLIDYLIS